MHMGGALLAAACCTTLQPKQIEAVGRTAGALT